MSSADVILTSAKRELFRGILSSDTCHSPLSAAGLQASRLATGSDNVFVIATGSNVYNVQCNATKKRLRSSEEGPSSKRPETGKSTSIVSSAISDEYIIPRPFSSLLVSYNAVHSAHDAEIQSVVANYTRLATIDAYGRCIVTVHNQGSAPLNKQNGPDSAHKGTSMTLTPPSLAGGMAGWAGIALHAGDEAMVATARQFYKDVTIYDADVAVRTLHSLQAPTAVLFTSKAAPNLLVAEGNDVALYDPRAAEAGGRMVRKQICTNGILAADVSLDENFAAVAGGDRAVYVFDTRMLNVRGRWASCLKFDCAGVLLSRDVEGMAFVCSVDNEVACGAWDVQVAQNFGLVGDHSTSTMMSGANAKSPRRAFGFRADVRITGMARRMNHGEEIAVVTEAGSFYLLRQAQN